MDKITIEQTEHGWIVSQNDRYADHLSYDEMLGTVVALTMPDTRPCIHWMKTKEQHDAWYNSLSPKLPELQPWQKLIDKQ